MFQPGAAPPRPHPGPPSPSPCSVCGACLRWQRIPCTIQGAAPMIRLQGSRLLLLRFCYCLETQHLLPQLSSCSSFPLRSQDLLESQTPPRSLALKGSGRAGGGGRGVAPQSPHQGLHLEGPDRTFVFYLNLSPAHRSTDQQQQQQPERQEQRSQGHDWTGSEHWGTRAGCSGARDQDGFPHSRPDWYGRVTRSELAPPPPAALPPLCPHLLEGKRRPNSLP